jgi:hypothetical protein
LVTSGVILYSLGYRFNFQSKKITQTGGFYFKVLPKNAEIYLNGKLAKKTDFFFGVGFIKNLLPEEYEVEIKKDGFHPWKKTLEIKEKQVTEFKNIILFPENPPFNILTKDVKDLFFSPDGKKIILKTETTSSPEKKVGWALKIFDLEKNAENPLIEESDISKKGAGFSDLKYSPDSKKILLKTEQKEELKYLLLDLEKNPIASTSLDFLGSDVIDISFHPSDPQKIFFTKSVFEETPTKGKVSKIYLFGADFNTKEISKEISRGLITYDISTDSIYWLSQDGYLFKSDFSGKAQEKLNAEPIFLKNEIEYQLFVKLPIILLKEGGALYLFNQDSKKFIKISDSVKGFNFSPDSQKIVYFNNFEIFILFFEKTSAELPTEAGRKLFLTRFSEKIGDVFWLNSHYLIFNVEDKLKISEIDERNINIWDLADFQEPKIFWSDFNKKLYLLSKEGLFVLENLLP